MRGVGASTALAAAGLFSAGAYAEDAGVAAFHAEEAAAFAALHETPGSFAGASRISPLTGSWTVLSFSVDGAPGQAPSAWRVRRVEGDAEGRAGEHWARSAACPALADALAALEGLSAPSVDAPGVGEDWRPRGVAVAADQASYRLWASGLRHGETREWVTLDLRASFSSPLADWMDETLDALAPCWTPASAPPG